jgi:cytochrome P450
LKADHALIPAAIEEAVRLESPVRAFARVATCDIDFDGYTLPEGGRVLVMYASANRDERRWEDPDRYRIDRPGLGAQLGFGQGRHACAGMHLARLEMRALLKAMVKRVVRIEADEPTYALNNVLRGFAALPVRFTR